MANWPREFRPIPLLCLHWMLAHRPFQQLVRPPRDNLPHLRFLCIGLLLAGVYEHLVAHVYCSLRPWSWNWSKICNRPDLCRGMYTTPDPGSISNAMANVDGIW
jgi:hypothetical protein